MQSRAPRKESSVSLNPNPSGLTTPAATTATRAGILFPFPAVVLSILDKEIGSLFLIAFLKEAFY
jgi:hypothetical protein